jgi:hypothetical protein
MTMKKSHTHQTRIKSDCLQCEIKEREKEKKKKRKTEKVKEKKTRKRILAECIPKFVLRGLNFCFQSVDSSGDRN